MPPKMPVDKKKNYVRHIPKAAGTSIEVAMGLINYKGPDCDDLIKAGKVSFRKTVYLAKINNTYQLKRSRKDFEKLEKMFRTTKHLV